MDYLNEADAKKALADPSLPPGELAGIAHRHPALRGEVAKHPSVYPGLTEWLIKYGAAKAVKADPSPAPVQAAPEPVASPMPFPAQPMLMAPPPVGAPIAGIVIILAGLSSMIVNLSTSYTSWTFGALPGVVSGLRSSGFSSGGFGIASTIVVGLVWIGVGIAVALRMYHNPVAVAGTGLAAIFLLVQVPSFEFMALPASFVGWSFMVVLQLIVLPLCFTIAMVLALVAARSYRPNRALAIWAIGLLVVAAVIALSFGIWLTASAHYAAGMFYALPAILFAIGWIVAINQLDRRKFPFYMPYMPYAPYAPPMVAPNWAMPAAPMVAPVVVPMPAAAPSMPADFQDRLAIADINTSAEMLYDIAQRNESLWPQIVAHPNAYQEMLDWMDVEGSDTVRAAIAKVRAQAPGTTIPKAVDGGPAFNTMEASINSWFSEYTDIVSGSDIVKWHDESLELFGPTMLLGQESSGIEIPPVLPADETVRQSWPCFFDDNPLQTPATPGQKTKFHGGWQAGLMVVTDEHVVMTHNTKGPLLMAFAVPRERVMAVNEMEFSFSALSMTSAGDGYEVLFADNDGTMGRWLFRTAVNVGGLNIPALVMPPAG